MKKACEKRGLPVGLLTLLEELTDVVPAKRPSVQKVVQKSTSLYVSHLVELQVQLLMCECQDTRWEWVRRREGGRAEVVG